MRQRTQKANQEAYFEAVDYTQQQMEHAGIDFRIVGSLASHALIAAAGGEPIPLKFQRPYAVEAVQALPDIDIVVPRSALSVARAIREDLAHADVPTSLGLAASSSDIDFRPDEDESYLTHGRMKIALQNKSLEAEDTTLHGTTIRTFPLQTQLHTYGTFGGVIRQKDLPTIRELVKLGSDNGLHDPQMQPFHEFMRYRRTNKTTTERAIIGVNHLVDISPALIGNALKVAGKKVASRKGLR